MIRWAVCFVALAGCDALFDLDRLHDVPADGGDGDADAHAGPSNDGRICVGHFMPSCPAFLPSLAITAPLTIDTSVDAGCAVIIPAQPSYPEVCVVGAETIQITARVTVTGARAIAFAATGTIQITGSGTIDASSSRSPLNVGPAANAGDVLGCTPTAGATQFYSGTGGGAGGGAGGSFGGTGGAGGASDRATTANSNFALTMPPDTLRGGCKGAAGGAHVGGMGGGVGGSSGGAVYLAAGMSITVSGRIMANGAAGLGGSSGQSTQHAGGGGAGSGGLIVLDAPMIDLMDGIVVAQGAGGGGGAYGTSPGSYGDEWYPSSPDQGAFGGSGAGLAGSGGVGSSGASPDGTNGAGYNMTTGGGAGGGGGGAGYVLLRGSVSHASQVYPAPISLQ